MPRYPGAASRQMAHSLVPFVPVSRDIRQSGAKVTAMVCLRASTDSLLDTGKGPGADLTAHRYLCSLPTGSQNRTPGNR